MSTAAAMVMVTVHRRAQSSDEELAGVENETARPGGGLAWNNDGVCEVHK